MRFAIAQDFEGRRTAQRFGPQTKADALRIIDGLSIDGLNDIAALQAGLGRRSARFDIDDHGASRAAQAKRFCDIFGDGLQTRAQPRTLDRLAAAARRRHDALDHIDGDGEANAHAAARARVNRRVYSDQPTIEIDERSTGIAGIDGGIGLDEEAIIIAADLRARERGDNALRHRLAYAKGIADGDDEIANFERVGIAQLKQRKFLVSLDLKHC